MKELTSQLERIANFLRKLLTEQQTKNEITLLSGWHQYNTQFNDTMTCDRFYELCQALEHVDGGIVVNNNPINTTLSLSKMIAIFDLDSTLVNIAHRLHFIKGRKKDYEAFEKACVDDIPILSNIALYKNLQLTHSCWIWTTRSDRVKIETLHQLDQLGITYDELRMRQQPDHRPSHEVKKGWLQQLKDEQRLTYSRIVLAFDDTPEVVDMYRSSGIPCIHIARPTD